MAGIPWRADTAADEAVIAANVTTVMTRIVAAAPSRPNPAVSLAHGWHRAIYRGVSSVPGPKYLGEPRGGADPDLGDYDVVLADHLGNVLAQGVPAARVQSELASFEASLSTATARLDAVIPPQQKPTDGAQLLAVVELSAIVHGEWVRIHPYANGNGRVARLWANWIATRYGLPPFVRIKPRPDGLLYIQAAHRSVGTPPGFVGDHSLTISLFLDLLRQRP